jgi:uncharacterized membrane protein YecN with MAPEG domain
MTLTITPIYAALITLLYLGLTWHVIAYRRANLISVGDTGDKALLKRIRAQANCAEYAPLGLILLLMIELTGAPSLAVHLLGAALFVGRIAHAYGFASTPQKMIFRQIGMVLTLLMLILSSIGLLAHAAL